VWIKNAFRDYYKPKLRRTLKHEPSQSEMDRRFEEIYSQTNSILLVGINEGVGIQFYEIARFTKPVPAEMFPSASMDISAPGASMTIGLFCGFKTSSPF